MKIMIAVPCMDQVPVQFCQSLAMIEKVGACSLAMKSGSLVYHSRNDLATQALQNDFDFVLWLDSDMTFNPGLLKRMMATLQENDLDMLTALCFRRRPPYSPALFDKLDIRGEECDFTEFEHIPGKLFEVGGCGFACMLMRTDVFLDVQGKHGNMFAPIGNNGEDVAFCWRARDCGFKIWCDPTIVCGHVAYQIIDDQFYRVFSACASGGKQ